MILDEIEEAVGKRLPQVYKDLVLTIDDFNILMALAQLNQNQKFRGFFGEWSVLRKMWP